HHDQHRRSRPRHAGPPGAAARAPTRGHEMPAATIPKDGRSSREPAAKSSPFSSQNCRPNSPMKSGYENVRAMAPRSYATMSEAQTNIGEEESIRRRSRTAMMSAAATAPEYASINGMPPSK